MSDGILYETRIAVFNEINSHKAIGREVPLKNVLEVFVHFTLAITPSRSNIYVYNNEIETEKL